MFDNESFWNNRYLKSQWLGSGPGSRGIAQYYKAHILSKMLSAYSIASIADIGCGDMCWLQTELLQEDALSGIDFQGIDISQVVIDRNAKLFPGFKFLKSDISKEMIENPVDLVLCFDVLIHQTSQRQFEAALKNTLAAVKSYGLISYHNPDKPDKPVLPGGFDQVLHHEDDFQHKLSVLRSSEEGKEVGFGVTNNFGNLIDFVRRIDESLQVEKIGDYRFQTLYLLTRCK
jgi:SAM-dependent methyltransferase